MNETQKAYIAGIIDGEGSIMLETFHKNQHPPPCISVASTTIELLNYLKEIIGFGVILYQAKTLSLEFYKLLRK